MTVSMYSAAEQFLSDMEVCMKKYWIGLGIGLIISLSGCGASKASVTVNDTSAQRDAGTYTDESSAPQTVADEDVKTGNGMDAPVFEWEHVSDSRYSDAGELLADFSTDKVRVSGEGYEKVSAAIEDWNVVTPSGLDDMAAEADEISVDFGYTVSYIDDTDIYIARADSTVISFKSSNYYYMGGAHGMSGYFGDTFDVASGEELAIDEMMDNADGFRTFARKYIFDEIQKKYSDEVFPEYESILADMWDENRQWYMDGNGLVIIFNPYELGPYAAGIFAFHIPYSELGDYMKPEYMDMSGAGIAEISDYSAVEEQLEEYGYIETAFRVKRAADSDEFLIVTTDHASDDYVTHVFDMTDGTAVLTDRTETGYDLQQWGLNADSFHMRKTIFVLGTYMSDVEYSLTDEGKLEEQNEIYEIESNRQWQGLVLKRELAAVDAGDGSSIVLPAGTSLYITATDDAGKVWFETEDGIRGMLEYERGTGDNDWILYIDGVSEYDYFEDIPYAG